MLYGDIRKKSTFYRTFFSNICKMYNFDQYARNHEHLDNKTVDYFFHQLI